MPIDPETRFGPYEIQFRLGAGGMGEVYLAHDARLGRDLAIKILPQEMAADPERLARFEKEARLASSLNHPNIVTIYDIGRAGTTPYIAMELVDGSTVRDTLRAGPMPLRQVLDVGAQIADGLAKAHEAGIVHRDLKPENVMITPDGLAKILDFGLGKHAPSLLEPAPTAKTIAADTEVTVEGRILGTADYMSPEQAAGRPVDFRSDQFSFGSLLCEMATGARPFHRDSAVQTLMAIIEAPPRFLASLTAPEPFRRIVERCLEKEPEKRYTTTRALAAELRSLAALMTVPEGVAPAQAPARPRRWSARRVAVAALAVLAVTATGVVVAVPSVRSWVLGRRGSVAAVPAKQNLAVLPFRAAGADPARQMFADGLTEALTAKLTQLTLSSSLQVSPAGEVRSRKVATPAQARMLLSANVILDGTLEQSGTVLRVTTRLVDPASLRELATRTETADAANSLALVDGVVDATVEMLQLKLTAAERRVLGARDTKVAAAKDAYLRARGYFQNLDTPGNIDRAISGLQEALTSDPGYALADAGLGEAYARKFQDTKDRWWIDQAQQACDRALALDAKLPAARGCLGSVFTVTGRYADAVPQFQQALASEPTSDEFLRSLAFAQEHLGQADEAEQTYRQAIALRPHYWMNYNRLGAFFHGRGRYQEATDMFKQVMALAPDSAYGYTNLGAAYIRLGRYSDAIPVLERGAAIRPTAGVYGNLANAYFNSGKFPEAARTFESAAKLDEKNYVMWGNLGDAQYWAPGERPKAAESYRQAIALGREQLNVNPRDVTVLGRLAGYSAMTGDKPAALVLLGRALQIAPNDPEVRFKAALVHNQFDDLEAALSWLEQAVAAGYSVTTIRDTPNFDHLWSNTRFQQLLRGR